MNAISAPQSGKLIIFTAPSGAGKTTIVRHLLKTFPEDLAFSISATTRARRPHEVDGKDYYFLDKEAFFEKVKSGAFAEWEEVYPGQWYGTLHREIERLWKAGKTILFDIDVKGASRLKEKYRERALVVFVAPPSIEVLEERLSHRNTESKSSLAKRIKRAIREMEYREKFDRILVNDDLKAAFAEAEQIVKSFIGCGSSHEEE